LTQAVDEHRWSDLLHPIDAALADRFPPLHLDPDAARRLCSGQAISSPANRGGLKEGLARVYGPRGTFLALAAYDSVDDIWRPRKVFRPWRPEPGGERSRG
jgi:tRNA U55 pseudouridine synthase TruB